MAIERRTKFAVGIWLFSVENSRWEVAVFTFSKNLFKQPVLAVLVERSSDKRGVVNSREIFGSLG